MISTVDPRWHSYAAKFELGARGREVFIKAHFVRHAPDRRSVRLQFRRERACLEILAGLAVPELVRARPEDMRTLLPPRSSWIAMRRCRGRALCLSNLSAPERIGAWLFLLEQLVAFRRHQILYTDVKCWNVLAAARPLSATVIDFGAAVPIPRTRTAVFAFSPGFNAPEQLAGGPVTESALVFQASVVLGCSLVGLKTHLLGDPRHGRGALLARLASSGCGALAPVVRASLDESPACRPHDFEALFSAVRGQPVPAAVADAWSRLREPCREKLAEVGL